MKKEEFYKKLHKEIVTPKLSRIAMQRGALTQLASKIDTNKQRITELKNGKRKLTLFWMFLLVKGGVITVDDIMTWRKMKELTDAEQEIVLRLFPDPELLKLIYNATQKGIDVKAMLRAIT